MKNKKCVALVLVASLLVSIFLNVNIRPVKASQSAGMDIANAINAVGVWDQNYKALKKESGSNIYTVKYRTDINKLEFFAKEGCVNGVPRYQIYMYYDLGSSTVDGNKLNFLYTPMDKTRMVIIAYTIMDLNTYSMYEEHVFTKDVNASTFPEKYPDEDLYLYANEKAFNAMYYWQTLLSQNTGHTLQDIGFVYLNDGGSGGGNSGGSSGGSDNPGSGGTGSGSNNDFYEDEGFTGLAQGEDGVWYCYINGYINDSYYGLYYDANYGWWLVEDGKINMSYNDLYYDANVGWWKVTNGYVDFGFNDLFYSPSYGWWKVTNGYVDFGFNDLYYSPNYGWWKINAGYVDFGFSNLYYSPNYGWWKIYNGYVDFDFSDLYFGEGYGWWKINAGSVDFGYNDWFWSPNYGSWYIENGAINFAY